MRTIPSYQRAQLESVRRSPWALIVVLAIGVGVLLLTQGEPGAPEPSSRPSVSAGPDSG